MRFIAPVLSVLYIAAILFGCYSYGDGGFDAFLPAFGLSPFGVPALAVWFWAVIKRLRNREQRSWGLWVLAGVLGALLATVIGFFVYLFSLRG